MNPTIPFADPPAAPLAPPDDPAALAGDEQWPRVNERRHELIRKEMEGRISAEELRELERLQAVAALRAAPRDRQLLAGIEDVLRRIGGPHDAPGP